MQRNCSSAYQCARKAGKCCLHLIYLCMYVPLYVCRCVCSPLNVCKNLCKEENPIDSKNYVKTFDYGVFVVN